jgi:hypothetical protein
MVREMEGRGAVVGRVGERGVRRGEAMGVDYVGYGLGG